MSEERIDLGQVPLDLGLTGRTIVVTGSGRGIGAAVAEQLARAGASIVAVDRDEAALESLRGRLDGDHLLRAVDLADLGSHATLVDEVRERYGRIDGLAHLAAVLRRRATIDDVSEEDWDVQIDVNLKATFFLNRAVAAAMRADGGGGSIVNFTSQGWLTGGFGGSVVYAASKGGIVSMSRGLARTLAPHGIRVNTVAPGAADTPMMRSGLTEEELAGFVDTIPIGRMAEPLELAGVVALLMSDHGRYITGATINATGGQIMY
jgi:NAD(P)-dependent dehydrogenase (short-subunit alcohol dehydrogenase family)